MLILLLVWLVGYLITAVLLIANADCFIGKIEAVIAVTLFVSWPLIWAINIIDVTKRFYKTKEKS